MKSLCYFRARKGKCSYMANTCSCILVHPLLDVGLLMYLKPRYFIGTKMIRPKGTKAYVLNKKVLGL